MEISQFRSLSELSSMEDSCFNFQLPFTSIDDQLSSFGGDSMHQLHAHAPFFDYHKPVMEPSPTPTKQLKTNTINQSSMNQNQTYGINLGITNQETLVKPKEEAIVSSKGTNGFTCNNLASSHIQFINHNNHVFNNGGQGGSNGGARMIKTLTPAQDHILAERKRREKLSQRFIALSALLPNPKKMDKASVLGDAIMYLKTLQEKVKTLEEQTKKITNTESVVFVKRFDVLADCIQTSSPEKNFSGDQRDHDQISEIEARFSSKNVLIRVHCEKNAGVVERTLSEIEKLHLCVTNSSTTIFANSVLDITVTAKMDEELTVTMKDLVKNLRSGLKQFL